MSTNLQPTNGLPKPFKAAKLFEDIGLWTKLCVLTKEAGGHVDKTAEEFVKTGLIKIRHKVAFKSNKTDVKFPHSKSRDSYRNYDALTAHFRSMTERERNYKTCKERPGEMMQLINRMLKEGGLNILMPQDRERVVLNPCNLLIKPNGKTMLLIHYSWLLQNNASCIFMV